MIKVRQVKVGIKEKSDIAKNVAKKLRINEDEILETFIRKESIDARDKKKIYYSYEVDVTVKDEKKVLLNNKSLDISITEEKKYIIPKSGNSKMNNRPVIVGSGPSGLFAAYLLAECGYNPLIIERGEKIEARVKSVEKFWKDGSLNQESNVAFGEGGAGTFSDGKLNTLVSDKYNRALKVFSTFVECGAPSEIMYQNKPHIGTDILRQVIINIREKIKEMGGEFLYNTKLSDVLIKNNKIERIEINDKELIECDILILAIGHSARDTFKMLHKRNINMVAKPFAVGLRIQHPQDMINYSQYGEDKKYLPNASYKLTYTASNNRGVYSFCMCPGGFVINSSSEKECLVINGMSNHERNSENANSAIVVTVNADDFENDPLKGLAYQEKLERLAYTEGKGRIPVQLWDDFKQNKDSQGFKEVNPVFKGSYNFANLNRILPEYISESIKEAIPYFDKKIKGFAREDAILAGVESRTSSPVRIVRDENLISSIEGIYPIGEGSGYAGGITTAAMDGIKVAEKIIEKYSK